MRKDMIKRKVCLRSMPTHHIGTSNVWVECVKLYGILILSLSRQLTGTSRALLQLCWPDKHLAMSFLPDGHVSLYLHLPTCLWWLILFRSIQDWATQPVCHPLPFPIKLSYHTSDSRHLCMQEGGTNKTKSHRAFSKTMAEYVSQVSAKSDFVCGVTFLTFWNLLLVHEVSWQHRGGNISFNLTCGWGEMRILETPQGLLRKKWSNYLTLGDLR